MNEFTRRAFYDLVWAKPMTDLAKQFGVSDVALHKTCKRHRIPTPGRGYWAKLAAGQQIIQTPFRDITERTLNIVRIYPSHLQSLPEEVKKVRAKARAEVKERGIEPIAPSTPQQLHPAVERLKRKLDTDKMKKSEYATVQDPKFFSVHIGPASSARVISVLDALIRQAEAKGYKIEAGEKALQLNMDAEPISLHIHEKNDKVPHVPTEKEARALQKWEEECALKRRRREWISEWDKPKVPEFDYPPNGQLIFEIDQGIYHSDGIRRKFSDGKSQRLEYMIPDILVAIATCAAAIKADHVERDRRQKEWEENRRLQKLEEKRQKLETKRAEALTKNMQRWNEAIRIRAFADAVENSLASAVVERPEKVKEWLAWTRGHADRIDPLFSSLPGLLHEKDFSEWEL